MSKDIPRECPYCGAVQGMKVLKEKDNWHDCPAIGAMVHYIPAGVKDKKNIKSVNKNTPMVSYVQTPDRYDPMSGGPTRGRG